MKNEKVELLNEVIRTRRSIFPAQYIDQEIHNDIINDILENANWAPNHKLTQPWRFKVLRGEAKGRLGDFMAAKYKEECVGEKFLEKKYQKLKSNPRKASAIILICMQRDSDQRLPEWGRAGGCCIGSPKYVASSHAYNIGSYWSSPPLISYMRAPLKTLFGLSESRKCPIKAGVLQHSPTMVKVVQR